MPSDAPDTLNETAVEAVIPAGDERDSPPIAMPPRWRLLPGILLAAILWATFVLKLHNLDHTALTRWDEAYHAVVARNVAEHPLRPTLVDAPYLPYDFRKWGENHVWLHKPILPFWQVALSFAVLGDNTFALRLPAAVLSTAAAWLTYLVGRNLVGRGAAVVAAALQAVNPFLMTVVHGHQFADTVDIALLFWVEAGMFFLARALRTGAWSDVCLAGGAQGLAFLSKSYLAAIITGVALAAWLLPLCRPAPPDRGDKPPAFGPARLLALLGVTLATVAPWLAYCATAYPEEFRHEHALVWRHLYADVEAWGAPWDRLVFDYLVAMYGVFYAPILVAAVVLGGTAAPGRPAGLWLVYAWGLGAVLPHLFAATKTPSMTVTAMPALFLLLGRLVAEAWRGGPGPLAALTAVLALGLVFPAVVREPGHGYPAAAGGVMRQALWVVGHTAGAVAAAAVVVAWCSIFPGGLPAVLTRRLRRAALGLCVCASGWLALEDARAAWRVTAKGPDDPDSVAAGGFARGHLPETAVLLCRETRAGEHVAIMFYADRTCYPLREADPDALARRVVAAGGIPYVVSPSRLPFPAVYDGGDTGPKVYRWRAR